jgi:hypothetical protein
MLTEHSNRLTPTRQRTPSVSSYASTSGSLAPSVSAYTDKEQPNNENIGQLLSSTPLEMDNEILSMMAQKEDPLDHTSKTSTSDQQTEANNDASNEANSVAQSIYYESSGAEKRVEEL